MPPEKHRKNIHWIYFALSTLVVIAVYLLYGFNMNAWKNSTDYGWTTMQDSGPHIVAEVFELGERAGLRSGDKIKAINGQTYTTFDELYFKVRNSKPGEKNVYTVERDGKIYGYQHYKRPYRFCQGPETVRPSILSSALFT